MDNFIGVNSLIIHELEPPPKGFYHRIARNRLHKWWLVHIRKETVIGTRKELTSKVTFTIDPKRSVPSIIKPDPIKIQVHAGNLGTRMGLSYHLIVRRGRRKIEVKSE